MYFSVLRHGVATPAAAISQAYLLTDNWDDWFKFNTLYSLVVFDAHGLLHMDILNPCSR